VQAVEIVKKMKERAEMFDWKLEVAKEGKHNMPMGMQLEGQHRMPEGGTHTEGKKYMVQGEQTVPPTADPAQNQIVAQAEAVPGSEAPQQVEGAPPKKKKKKKKAQGAEMMPQQAEMMPQQPDQPMPQQPQPMPDQSEIVLHTEPIASNASSKKKVRMSKKMRVQMRGLEKQGIKITPEELAEHGIPEEQVAEKKKEKEEIQKKQEEEKVDRPPPFLDFRGIDVSMDKNAEDDVNYG
jgi:hypothetical protein